MKKSSDVAAGNSARREAMGGLAKGLEVIRAFSHDSPSLTLSEIAGRAGLPAATARRCLLTLSEQGYVMQSGRNFLLRPKVLELGAAYLDSMNIEMLTRTYLEDLASQTGDSAALTVLDGAHIVYVARASVRTLMRLEAHVGSRLPAYPTSLGRVLLAGLSPERLDRYFEQAEITALTERTVTDKARLRALIEECRRVGYSSVEDELAYGVVAVAVPVFDKTRRVVAALNSSSHSKKTTRARLAKERVPLLQTISSQISRELQRVPGLSLSAQT
ncbi:helix-turn-helix domain-containing protein [Steroidobacter sp. S1-65]|uniref:Helix-turn-helix domain-containing protein n=2 Tax=Steroidobacter gossypii TaxID=2805490 RepID=A0ABS1X144_9GAMM|nr:helix-turn-helix domain-containing protein [Steroidobacter gossypii]